MRQGYTAKEIIFFVSCVTQEYVETVSEAQTVF